MKPGAATNRSKWMRIALLLLCVSFPFLKTAADRSALGGGIGAMDFAAVYYQARCVLHHTDAYDPQAVSGAVEAGAGRLPATNSRDGRVALIAITVANYLPTTYLILAPLSALPWPDALTIWMSLISGLLVMAAFGVWDLAPAAATVAGCMSCWMLLNAIILLWFGNTAGIAAPLCVIAAWCLLKERYAMAGVVALALSLTLKPQVAGFVWLYFLLAGRTGRKRALQTLAVTAILGAAAAIWIAPASPRWIEEMHNDVAVTTVRGGVNDPGPTGETSRGFDSIISLQTTMSELRNDPGFYNWASYLIGGGLILVWIFAVVRKSATRESALLALAAAALLTMLPVYHRAHDAKLLLLTIPACAMLWARGGARRWWALGLTSAAIVVTSDVPLIILNSITGEMAISAATLGGKVTLLLLHPQPLVLLATGCFYLWVYIRYKPAVDREQAELAAKPVAAAGA